MGDGDVETATRLATMSAEDLGRSEEEVKINFVVPLLELLGHSRLRFEYKQKDIVLREGLPARARVVVETKRAGATLDRHLEQLARYSAEERSFLSVLTNGEAVRIYAPLWAAAPSFAHTLLWALDRAQLASPHVLFELTAVLGAEALASGRAARRVADRQARLEGLWYQAETVRLAAQQQREQIESKLRAVEERVAALGAEKKQLLAELARIEAGETETLKGLYGCAGEEPIEPPATKPEPPAPAAGKPAAAPRPVAVPGEPGEWYEDELYEMASDLQRLFLGAFVRLGRRSLHLRDIEQLTGASAHRLWGAISGMVKRAREGTREMLIEVTHPRPTERTRRCVIVTIAEKYWPMLQRVYAEREA